jgi:hypothetical protein
MFARSSITGGETKDSPVRSVCRKRSMASVANGSCQTMCRTSAKSRPISGSMPLNTASEPLLIARKRNSESMKYTPNGAASISVETIFSLRRRTSSACLRSVISRLVPHSPLSLPSSIIPIMLLRKTSSRPSRAISRDSEPTSRYPERMNLAIAQVQWVFGRHHNAQRQTDHIFDSVISHTCVPAQGCG